ncbi:BgTH12-00704 [Blumeria graminis f. sp. triticale]|uniref:BgTH12-00704 n=1 Tax=Blumeria graminis f. sp. triticale TaxID=1689686 RepID=A0A9W4D5J1_BLUGR|nr:BgTH12-00704 [Blumeria graminis f. sp. triticale]
MAPPVTPSPHRFLLAKTNTTSTQQTPSPSPSQFNSAPRFNVPSISARPVLQDCPQTIPPPLRHSIFAGSIAKDYDSIELDAKNRSQQSYSKARFTRLFSRQDEEKINESSPKRKKLLLPSELEGKENESVVDEIQDISNHLVSNVNSSLPLHPFTPKSQAMARISRFKNTPTFNSVTSSETQDAGSSFIKPPIFRPSESVPEHYCSTIDPQLIQFSPHRRGHKYISGGLAATLQGWLLNIENHKPSQPGGISPMLMNVIVDDFIYGGITGMILISGNTSLREGEVSKEVPSKVKLLLAGKGTGTESQSYRQIVKGSTIGIRAPTWQMNIKEEKWNIAVEWVIVL